MCYVGIRPVVVKAIPSMISAAITHSPQLLTTSNPHTTIALPISSVTSIPKEITTIALPISSVTSIPKEIVRASYNEVVNSEGDVFALVMGVITLILLLSWIVIKIVRYRSRFIAAVREFYKSGDMVVVIPTPPIVIEQTNTADGTVAIDCDLINVTTPLTERRDLTTTMHR